MTDAPSTAMATEIAEAPDAVARFFDREDAALRGLGARLRALAPAFAVTCARGSSDHAAGYFTYALEILAGIPVASIGPSVASIYRAPLRLRGAVLLSVSQSGKSPDIVALQAAARAAGAFAVAVVNDVASPLALQADAVLPLHAGRENSVAATKSCLSSAVILAALVAELVEDNALRSAVRVLPEALGRALAADWGAPLPMLTQAISAYVVGRGPALPVAMEAALKLKETAVLHAEAFSGAEVMHGPLQLLHAGFPVIAFRPRDAAHAAMGEAIARLTAVGGHVFTSEDGPPQPGRLPFTSTGHSLLDPLAMLLAFYGLAEQVARARGQDPDHPSHLSKITETV
jgi:glucosamine--fructose-6-phosphate aminotransferase (isomerizing)